MDNIKCPSCGHEFELSATLAAPLVAEARARADEQATLRIAGARKQIEEEERARALDLAAAQLAEARARAAQAEAQALDAQNRVAATDRKLTEAQAAQAAALRKERELDDARRELELTIERRTTEGLARERTAAEQAVEERMRGQVAERDQTIASMARTVEDLRRKAEQGSQQTQGEVQELALEAALRAAFPLDSIEPVGKGVSGGDCVHVVSGGAGRILWESKRTKAWSDGWLPKVRDDGRAAMADVLVIASAVMPQGVDAFGQVDGVWVCLPKHAVPLAAALRHALASVAEARKAGENVETKAGLVYSYLVGPKFKSRVSAIVEAFTTMREDLDAERRAIGKQWAKREAQIERVLTGTVGMYGDLQAIAGRSLDEIEGLELRAIAGPGESLNKPA